MSARQRVVIVGGGIAGLAAAWRLRSTDDSISVTLLEAEARLGGRIRTDRFDGYLVEAGPDSFLTTKPWALELTASLGIDDELVPLNRLRHRALIRGSHGFEPLPPGLSGLVPDGAGALLGTRLLGLTGRLRAMLDLVLPGSAQPDESIAAFVRRRFGRQAWDRLMEPLLAGINGGDGETLSLPATFPVLAEAERRSGSVIRGLRSMRPERRDAARSAFVAPRRGMGALVDAIVERLTRVQSVTGARAERIGRTGGHWVVDAGESGNFECDAVIIATPANIAASIVRDVSVPLADALASIPFASSMVVQTAFDGAAIGRPLDSGGYLNPRRSNRGVTACTFSSSKFDGRAPAGAVLLRTIPRIGSRAALDAMTDERAVAIVLDELRDSLGVTAPPLWTRVYRHADAMPQYTLGHLDLLRTIRDLRHRLPGLALAGNSYAGIGIPDTVRSATDAADVVVRSLEATRVPAGR